MKLTRKQIDMIINNTPAALKSRQIGFQGDIFGTYQISGANWSYIAVYIDYNGGRVLVVKQFGIIL